jgi:hypothetical protein
LRLTTASVSLLLIASATADRLGVYASGQRIGVADVTIALTRTGGVHTNLEMSLSMGGNTSQISLTSECDRSGKPLYTKMTTKATLKGSPKAKPTLRTVSITFRGPVAKSIRVTNGKTDEKSVSAPAGANIADASQFWFIRDKPRPGQMATYYSFNAEQPSWIKTTTKYLGLKDVTVGGKTRKAHQITTTRGGSAQNVFVDSKGGIVKMELGGLLFQAD